MATGSDVKLVRSYVASANYVISREVVGSLVWQRDASRIEHLQKEVPYQSVRLLNFIKEKNAFLILRKNSAQSAQ